MQGVVGQQAGERQREMRKEPKIRAHVPMFHELSQSTTTTTDHQAQPCRHLQPTSRPQCRQAKAMPPCHAMPWCIFSFACPRPSLLSFLPLSRLSQHVWHFPPSTQPPCSHVVRVGKVGRHLYGGVGVESMVGGKRRVGREGRRQVAGRWQEWREGW